MIVLTILHTVGKVVLILFVVFAISFALLLFFPATYRFSGKFNGGARVHADVKWLFPVIFLRASFDTVEKKPKVVLRILGIPLRLYPRKPKKEKKKKKRGKEAEEQIPEMTASPEEAEAETTEAEADATIEEGRARSFFQKIADFFRSLPERLKKKKEKAASIMKKVGAIKNEMTDPHNKEAIKHLLSEVKNLLSHYKPRHLKMNLEFSTGDPAKTGELLGVISVLPFAYLKGNRLVPDFAADAAYIRGKASISGHVILFFAVAAGVRLIMDKNIRRLIKHVKAIKG